MFAKHVIRLTLVRNALYSPNQNISRSLRVGTPRKLVTSYTRRNNLNSQFQLANTIKRQYTLSFRERIEIAASRKKKADPFADRERGDLSEYNHQIHGLSMLTGGRDLEVLRAWGKGNFVEVLDICDDMIEDNRYALDEKLSGMFAGKSPAQNSESQIRENQQTELYLFHRNVKAAALNQLHKWTDAIRVADETLRLTNRRDRDALCLKGAALNALGSAENSAKHNEEALECFTEALQLLPSGGFDLEAMLNQATLYFKLGRHNEAEEVVRAALNMVEESSIAPAANESSSLENALSKDPFSDTENTTPNDPHALRQSGLDREHIKYDPDLHMLMAAIYTTTNRPEATLDACRQGVAALKRKTALGSPHLARFYEIQFNAFVQLRRMEEAELVAKMLLKVKPDSFAYLDQYVRLMMHLQRPYTDISPILKAFVPNVSYDGRQYVMLLELMLTVADGKKEKDEVGRITTEILKLGPHETAYQIKAVFLVRAGRPHEALALCDEAIGHGFAGHEIHLAKALAFEALQQWDEASYEYEAVLLKDPNYGPAHYHLGKSLARRGRHSEALQAFDRALSSEPNPVPQILIAKAMLLKDMGRLRESLEVYQRLGKIDPSVAAQLPTLANAWKKGNPREFTSPDTLNKVQAMYDHVQSQLGPGGVVGNLFGGNPTISDKK